ncbi:MAG: serine kinase [Methylophagaceae bacterium]
MKSVFVLEHLHTLPSSEESWKRIGIYRTWDDALAAIERVKSQPGFSNYSELVDRLDDKDGFHIDEYHLNEDNWQEGYVTV